MLWESVFGAVDPVSLTARLEKPTGPVDVVLDTDAYNEVDDQYALAYLLRSEPDCRVRAITAAPFYSAPGAGRVIRSSSPEDGMERSYHEILKVLDLMDRGDMKERVYRGSTQYLPGPLTPVPSEAAEKIIEISREYGPEQQLYVVAIGAITNVSSAILMEPRIIDRIVVVWLGGNPTYWPTTREFNLMQDVHAARVVLDCGVPFVHVPCKNVSQHLRTTLPELEAHIGGKNALCDFLLESFRGYHEDHFAWAKELWDVATIAWLVCPDWMPSALVHSPILTDQLTWSEDAGRHLIRVLTDCHRNPIFADVFRKLAEA